MALWKWFTWIFPLSKIPSSTLQPIVPLILSTSKEVLAMSDSINLAKDLLGKFDIENVFCKIFPFPGSDKDIFFHQTTKGKIYITIYIYKSYLYYTIMIHNSIYHFTRYVKNINCDSVLYSFNLLFFTFLISRLAVFK